MGSDLGLGVVAESGAVVDAASVGGFDASTGVGAEAEKKKTKSNQQCDDVIVRHGRVRVVTGDSR